MPLVQMGSKGWRSGVFAASLAALSLFVAFRGVPSANAGEAKRGDLKNQALAQNPLSFAFIENAGQWDDQALFYAGTPGLDVWMNKSGLVYDFFRKTRTEFDKQLGTMSLDPGKRSGQVISLNFLGSNPTATAKGVDQMPGYLNFIRNKRTANHVGLFEEARLNNLYTGIDLRLYKDQGRPRFDFIVSPGADPSKIQFNYEGAKSLRLSDDGSLMVGTRFGEAAVTDLFAYQNVNGQQQRVECRFVIGANGVVKFRLGNFDRNRELVIDPVVYSTLYGGFGVPPFIPGNDIARAVAVDSFNNAYVTGNTDCPFYPVTNGVYDNTVAGSDAFVTKFARDASALVYSTVIGGGGTEIGLGIAVDSQGRAVICGATGSASDVPADAFPTTDGAPQQVWGGGFDLNTGAPLYDAFASRLSADGSELDFSTYYGGNGNLFPPPGGNDIAYAVGLDSSDNIYVAGQAESGDFVTTSTSFEPNGQGGRDGFVFKVTNDKFLEFCTFIGGTGSDTIRGMAVDEAGFCHLTGTTSSLNFPTTNGAFDRSVQNGDAFVTKLLPTGDVLEFSTVIGGSASDSSVAIAIDADGNSYICGSTQSVDFPRTPGCYDNVFNPNAENFVTKVALDGASLRYSTFMNGGGSQTGIAVDDQGVAHICGIVLFPVISVTATGDDQTYNGPNNPLRIGDAYLQALNEGGSELFYGSYFGGEEDDGALGIVIDKSRNAFFVGFTNSWTAAQKNPFPTTEGVFKPAMSNDNPPNLPFWDSFLVKAKVRPAPILTGFTIDQVQLAGTESATATITLSQAASPGGAVVRLTTDRENVAKPDDGAGNLLEAITIPEGQTTATFPITTSDVTQTFTVNFQAELEGDTKDASVTVAPWLTNLSLSPNSIVGGNKVTGRVVLYRPSPANGLEVEVTSSRNDLAFAVDANNQPITSFTVPTGNTAATFTILTRGVDANTVVSVLTRVITPNLSVVRSQNLTIRPAKLKTLAFSPLHVNGGERSVGTITLDGEVGPTPARFDLSLGTGTAPVTFPTPVAVGARKSFVNFYATTGFVATNAFRNIIATRQSDPTQTKQGTLFVDAIAISGITLSATSVQGGATVTGFVELTRPASTGGFKVDLATSSPTVAPLSTTSVTVPVGALRSPNFSIATKVTPVLVNATITASKTGYPSKTATLTIRPVVLTLTLDQTSVVGGFQNVSGTVSLNEAPNSSLLITLTSSRPTVLSLPSSVRITAPNRTATFVGTTTVVNSNQNVTITASTPAVPNAITTSRQVLVTPPIPTLVALTLTPSRIVGGGEVLGRVILEHPAPLGGVVVTLSKDPNATGSPFASLPPTVTIPAGARNATFIITTSLPSRTVSTTITADIGPNSPTVSAVLTILRS